MQTKFAHPPSVDKINYAHLEVLYLLLVRTFDLDQRSIL
jgi:hypothetical protein